LAIEAGKEWPISVRRRPLLEASSPAHNLVVLVLEAGTAKKSGYIAILIGDIFG